MGQDCHSMMVRVSVFLSTSFLRTFVIIDGEVPCWIELRRFSVIVVPYRVGDILTIVMKGKYFSVRMDNVFRQHPDIEVNGRSLTDI